MSEEGVPDEPEGYSVYEISLPFAEARKLWRDFWISDHAKMEPTPGVTARFGSELIGAFTFKL